MIGSFLLVSFFLFASGFSPIHHGNVHNKHQRIRIKHEKHRPILISTSSWDSAIHSTTDEYITNSKLVSSEIKNNSKSKNNFLELDSDTGCLKLGGDGGVLVKGLNPATWSSSRPPNGDTNALFLQTAHPEESAEHQTVLGDLISCRRLLACSRLTRYWMGPKVGSSAEDLPFDTQFLLIEIEEGHQYALMLPLVDQGFRASIHCDEDSSIGILCAAESGDAAVKSKGMQALYVAVGSNPFTLVKEGFSNVALATKTFQTLDRKELPPSVDEFGWCTWDAFYSAVNPEGVLNGIQSLREAGVPPRTIILDDGWQEVTPHPPETSDVDEKMSIFQPILNAIASPFVHIITRWYGEYVRTASYGSLPNTLWSILANSILKGGLWNYFDSETDFNRQLKGFAPNEKFEASGKSLKGLVTDLKTKLGVKYVYCWHALHGYWRGVSEELGQEVGLNVKCVFPKPSKSLLKLEPQAAWDPVSLFGVGIMSTKKDLRKFYNLIHGPLVEAGVDGVKVDVQSGVSAAGDGVGGGPHLAKMYTMAMEESVSKRFPSGNGATNTINCMCHSTENLYRYNVTSVARASEDFFPGRPESHTVHLVNVAYNSLFIGEICLPDWDMFHSKHESAGLHGAARAVGGCPIYVSDKPGHHDPELLRRLVLPDGSILRAREPGRPTRDCLFVDVTADKVSALKIWNHNHIGGVVGAFNVQGVAWNFDTNENEILDPSPGPVIAEVKAYDVEGMRSHDGPFIVWKHRAQMLEFLESGNDTTKIPLDHREWEIFTIVPIQVFGNFLMWAPIGLGDMMNSGGAVVSGGAVERCKESGAAFAQFESRGPGRFVSFANHEPARVTINKSTDIEFSYDRSAGVLSFQLPGETSENSPHHVRVEWK